MDGFVRDPRPRQPLGNGELLAYSHAGLAGMPDLYLVDDQQGIRAIAQSDQYDVSPEWSPDGSRLLYQRSYGWSTRFYLIKADGTGTIQLTADDAYKFKPRWSPDGNRIAFLGVDLPGDPSGQPVFLFVLDVANGAVHKDPVAGIMDYTWLPEGGGLAAVVRTENAVTVEEYQADGDHAKQIAEVEIPPGAGALSLSPDVRWLAYVMPSQDLSSLTDPLYVTSIVGSETNRVGAVAADSSLVWSPDSSRIALVTFGDESHYALFTMKPDGRDQRQLMVLDSGDESGAILPGMPAWSSNSRQIAISSFVSPGGSAIFVVNADGSNLRQITEPEGLILDLSWRPTVGRPVEAILGD